MAVGTPVVSTDCPSGPKEILEFGQYGSLMPVGDVKVIAEAIVATLKRPKDNEAARQRAQSFSLETAVNSYLKLIKLDATR